MNAFEQIVSEILWMDGHWVRTSVKVELTKEEKVQIGRPSSPRWELDIVAFEGGANILRIVECKSYLDSRGVSVGAFDGTNPGFGERFKLFNDPVLRRVVFNRLQHQLAERGACPPNSNIKLCLACGRIATAHDAIALRTHFSSEGWELWDEHWLRDRLMRMANAGYENQVASVVSKLLLKQGSNLTQRQSSTPSEHL